MRGSNELNLLKTSPIQYINYSITIIQAVSQVHYHHPSKILLQYHHPSSISTTLSSPKQYLNCTDLITQAESQLQLTPHKHNDNGDDDDDDDDNNNNVKNPTYPIQHKTLYVALRGCTSPLNLPKNILKCAKVNKS
jgi:hypothetical protein